MPGRKMLCLGVTILLIASGVARARHGGGGHMHGGGHHQGFPGMPLVAVGGGYAGYWYGGWPYAVGGTGYYSPYYPSMMGMGPGGMVSPFGPMPVRGTLIQAPPPAAVAPWARGGAKPASAPNDPKRAAQLLTFGDRLFRGGNLKKAEERYLQARNISSESGRAPAPARPARPDARQLHRGRQPAPRGRDRRARLAPCGPGYPVDLRRAHRIRPPAQPSRILRPGPSRRPRCLAGPGGGVVPLRPDHPRGGRLPPPR